MNPSAIRAHAQAIIDDIDGGVTPTPIQPNPNPTPTPPPTPQPPPVTPPTNGQVVYVDFDWSNPTRQPVDVGPNDVVVARFTTGNKDSASNNLPRISGSEFGQGGRPTRYAVLSASPGDFGPQPQAGAVSAGQSVQVPFAVGLGNNWGYYPILQKNTTYYFNVRPFGDSDKVANTMMIELSVPGDIR